MASNPTIHRLSAHFSASDMLEAVGDAIAATKKARCLTYGDVGAAFGKSEDVAASYRAGMSDMPLSAFLRGTAALGDGVGNAALAYIGRQLAPLTTAAASDDSRKLSPVSRAVSIIADATSPDSEGGAAITDDELMADAAEIERAWGALDELRHRIDRVRAARRAGVA